MATNVQYQEAVNYALSVIDNHDESDLVNAVRNYFNDNGIEYETFSNKDLEPYL